jgi:hypothetical protein
MDHKNYELYNFNELGRGEKVLIETGRKITIGEYSGISLFKHVVNNFNLTFKNDEEARQILGLVLYANVHKQKPLIREEFRFIAEYPKIVSKILTLQPPRASISKISIKKEKKEEKRKIMHS